MADSQGLLRYDGELVDDGPILVVAYSQQVREYIIAATNLLRDRALWHPSDDVDTALQQIDALNAILLGVDNLAIPDFPVSAFLMFSEAWFKTGTSKLTPAFTASQVLGVVWYPVSPGNGDTYDFFVNQAAGYRYLRLIGLKNSSQGKSEIYIDGQLVTGSLFDWYNGSFIYNQEQRIQVFFDGDARPHIQVKVNGKHASSTNYYLSISAVIIEPNQP